MKKGIYTDRQTLDENGRIDGLITSCQAVTKEEALDNLMTKINHRMESSQKFHLHCLRLAQEVKNGK